MAVREKPIPTQTHQQTEFKRISDGIIQYNFFPTTPCRGAGIQTRQSRQSEELHQTGTFEGRSTD